MVGHDSRKRIERGGSAIRIGRSRESGSYRAILSIIDIENVVMQGNRRFAYSGFVPCLTDEEMGSTGRGTDGLSFGQLRNNSGSLLDRSDRRRSIL